MAYQVIWTRLLGLIIGPTTYSFTLVVTVFIVGLALGSFVFGRIGDRVRRPLRLLAATQLMAGGLALGVSQFLGNSQFFFAKLIYTFQEHFIQLMTAQSALIFLVLLGPTLLLGATFPLVSKIYARSLERMGRAIGTAYALNTVGAILGSFAAGFLLVPLLGKQDSLRLVTGVQIAVALGALAFYGIRARTRAFLWLPVSGATAVVSAVLLTAYPAWDRQLLSFGRYHNFQNLKPRLTATSWLTALWNGPDILTRSEAGREVVFYGDGIAGFTTVERLTDSMGTVKFTMLNSGKPDASSHGDRSTQTLLAHVPLLFHAHAKTVMVLGLASGMTAGEVLHYPVERVDVVEISKEVVEACRIFGPWNNNILGDARSRIIVQDGRNHLALTKETYDVITSEPSNPWMAGLANLYTLEFFQTVKRRLREGGIFVQWIHSYEMDWPTFALAGRTFSRVFPNSLLMTTLTGLGDYLLVGFKGSGGLDLKVARKNLPYAEKSRNMTLKDPRLIYQLIVSEDLKALFGPGPIHTDNRPRLEFSAPKQLYQSGTSVDETVAQRRSLSQKTREIVRATSSADGLLDMLAFSASAYSPLFGILNPDTATPAQRDRYFRILQSYCDRNLVETYTPFPNQATRESCARRQIKRIRQHLSEAPGDASGYYSLGIALKEAGHGDEAVKAYAKAVSLNPQNADAYNNLGIIHMENGDLKKARDACGKALAVDPTHANALFNLAQIALREGKKDEALSHLRKGLQYEDNPVAKRLVREILLSD
jgi:spermidine synthase